jgi:nucleoside-diphosphate-sugar epimerase
MFHARFNCRLRLRRPAARARSWRGSATTVFGLRRSALAEAELQAAGITPLHADITRPETLAKLPRDFDWVVNCTASGGGDADDYRKIYLEGNRNLIAWLAGLPLKKFVYTSSTSVYGQNDGSSSRKKALVAPDAETSKVLVETENSCWRRPRRKDSRR